MSDNPFNGQYEEPDLEGADAPREDGGGEEAPAYGGYGFMSDIAAPPSSGDGAPAGGTPAPSAEAFARGNYGNRAKAGSVKEGKLGKGPKIAIIVVSAIIAIAAAAGGIAYAADQQNRENIEFYKTHFFEKTYVGGVDVSRMTASEAADAVNADIDKASVEIRDGAEAQTFTMADAKAPRVQESFFDGIVEGQDSTKWKDECARDERIAAPDLVLDRGAIAEKVEKLDCVSGTDRIDAVDATLTMEGGEFSITPGKDGNRADGAALTEQVLVELTGGAYQPPVEEETAVEEENPVLVYDIDEDGIPDDQDDMIDADKDGYYDEPEDIKAAREAAEDAFYAAKKEAGAVADEPGFVEKMKGTVTVADADLAKAAAGTAPIDAGSYLVHPRWWGDEKQFSDAQDKARKWLGAEIDYTIDMIPHAAKVDGKVIEKFIVINQDKIDVELDRDAVKAWLHETCAPYDTVGTEREYTTPGGSKIMLGGGSYGWMTDERAELPLLMESIEKGEKVSRDMSYEQTAAGPKGGREWGNTYIDIDITSQTVSYIQNGEVVFSAETVSGNEDGKHYTKRGWQQILWKASPHVMVGEIQANGEPEYRTPCTFFILFNGDGSALHDADWRGNWSTSAHLYDGSHGCCNMHYGDVATLWDLCSEGDPVIVHD